MYGRRNQIYCFHVSAIIDQVLLYVCDVYVNNFILGFYYRSLECLMIIAVEFYSLKGESEVSGESKIMEVVGYSKFIKSWRR